MAFSMKIRPWTCRANGNEITSMAPRTVGMLFTGIAIIAGIGGLFLDLIPDEITTTTLSASRPGEIARSHNSPLPDTANAIIIPANTAAAAVAVATPSTNNSETQAPRQIEVFGRVTDGNNQPIQDVLVSDESQFGSVRSNHLGKYRILLTVPTFKTPFLNFLRRGFQENRIGVPVDNRPAENRYPINVHMNPAPHSTSSRGWVRNELGEGVAGQKVALRVKGGQEGGYHFYAVISDSKGEFLFEGIRSNLDYRLEIEASERYAGFILDPYRVRKFTPDATITLDSLELTTVAGLIVDSNGAPIGDFSLSVQNLSVDYPVRRISSDASGFFKLENFPAGELKFSTNSPDFFKFTGFVLDQNEYRVLTLAIDRGNYHLTGWVGDEHGMPMANARVTLKSVLARDDYHSYAHRSIVTTANGEFEFSNLGNIPHTLTVYARGYDTYIYNHRFATYSDRLDITLSR
ncbi:MAG: hypothetical protein ACI822_003140 [Gammaproteobacteria bacterium]|jgi:hypothetical protein